MWGNITDDRIHLYVLPPLIEAGKKLNKSKYIETANRVLEHYKRRKDLLEFNILSHFYTYVIESLCDLGELDLAKRGMELMGGFQNRNGSIPAFPDVKWICNPGVAQFAIIVYKLGMQNRATKAFTYLYKIRNPSGGFYGSYGKGANYFPDDEISWAAKFFIDAVILSKTKK